MQIQYKNLVASTQYWQQTCSGHDWSERLLWWALAGCACLHAGDIHDDDDQNQQTLTLKEISKCIMQYLCEQNMIPTVEIKAEKNRKIRTFVRWKARDRAQSGDPGWQEHRL